MKTINPKHRFCGVCRAAAEANVTRQHIYLCLVGQRHPSEKVAKAIEKHVTVFTQTPVAGQRKTARSFRPGRNHKP